MFLFEDDFVMKKTKLRGVTYLTVSFYSGKRDILQRVGDLIASDTTNVDKVTSESSLGLDIAIEKPSEYCCVPEGGESQNERDNRG